MKELDLRRATDSFNFFLEAAANLPVVRPHLHGAKHYSGALEALPIRGLV